MNVRIRDATPADEEFLWTMLTYAASMDPGGAASVAAAKSDDNLGSYVKGWMRAGDLGVVAVDGSGAPLGAAWLRLLEGPPMPFKVATPELPELAIAVEPRARGQKLGASMLEELFRRSSGRYPAIVLSVRATNPSIHLYERAGFVEASRIPNRVGGDSIVMRRAL
ncbi:Histone acetyltransferase HPA2 [Labilithrix luteola]|uniref:Histone acetyltransferase HPA2 n=1 Tax=Labilithrix luteola TaxID=1391654 RepID=A0A0K1Q881_9BACT|nr:N-acetyltransferase [Labilithrix luteola]AKV01948.1 Histone acetyltransferase HPA2 [Labilithrix luteola]